MIAHHATHPLLLHYNEDRTTLYINSRPENPQALLEDIEAAVDSIFQGWHDWRCVLWGNRLKSAVELTTQNITQGSGILLDNAPASIVKAVVAVCEKHGAATRFFGSLSWNPLPHEAYSVLLIGSCYVVARDFKIHPV